MNAKLESLDIFVSWWITSDGDFISENGCISFESGVEEGSRSPEKSVGGSPDDK